MLPRNVQTSLLATQLVAFATLARSVAFGYWFTVVASSLMIIGALAASRHRTWGVLLAFASAATFAVAAMIGIAPMWFLGVGAIGALPLLLTSDALGRADRQAASILTGVAAGAGAAAAVTWAVLAWKVFVNFPFLAPTRFVQNGLGAAAVLALGMVVAFAQRNRGRGTGLRIAEAEAQPLRIAEVGHAGSASTDPMQAEEEAGAHEEALATMRGRG